jgi:hypothetical protein
MNGCMGRVHHKLQSETNAAKIKQLASVVCEPVHDVRVDEANFVSTMQQMMHRGSDAGVL